MADIVIRGTLGGVMDKLERVQETARNRGAIGWEPLLPDESWMFVTRGDDKVCPICSGEERKVSRLAFPRPMQHREHKVYRGNEIPNMFPFYFFETPVLIRPMLHSNCRCKMEWIDPAGTLQRRLHTELVISHGG